jgi:arginyl-tRNA synthetase
VKKKLGQILKQTLDTCFEKGTLTRHTVPEYVIEVPNHPEHGHFATNLPLVLASFQRRRPAEIAHIIADNLADEDGMIEKFEIAGPGFINFFIKPEEWYRAVVKAVLLGDTYGRSELGKGNKVLVEFVSANPTGPLHLGHGRGAALGDTLCRILSFCGYNVFREFYINDAGRQIRLLGESIFHRWKQMTDPGHPFPENGYHGDYVEDLAKDISGEIDLSMLAPEEAIERCAEAGKEKMLEEIRQDLALFRTYFNAWYPESDLYSSGLLEEDLEMIRHKGHIYERDGAHWIKTSSYGDDKDRVIRKSDGQYTYFASDISYHLEKWKRGFSKAINIWGADHHGYVQRVKAALKANDLDEDWLSVLLIQLVKLWKGGQEIRMSKRAGNYVTVRELVDEVGVDAVRFVFLTKSHDSPLDFDIDLVKKHDSDNPVYYVQYAHARICSIFRKSLSAGIPLPEKPHDVLGRLAVDEELSIIRLISAFEPLLEDICRTLEAHRLTYYLTEVASAFHKYFNLGNKYPELRVITKDIPLTQARLYLTRAVQILLQNGLGLLGIHAPERM